MPEGVGEVLEVGEGVMGGLGVMDGLAPKDRDDVGVGLGEHVLLDVTVPDAVPLKNAVTLAVLEGDDEGVPVTLEDGDGVTAELGVIDGLAPYESEEVGLGL